MLIVALVLAVIGLAALVTAVVTSNELVAWVCIGASGLGVLLLIVDAVRERAQRRVPVALPSPATGEVGAMVAAADTEIIAPAAVPVVEPVETTVVIEQLGGEADPDNGPEVEGEAEIVGTIDADIAIEDHPDEVVHDEPDYDLPTEDEPDFPVPAEEAAIHVIDEGSLDADYVDGNSVDDDYRDGNSIDDDYRDGNSGDDDYRDESSGDESSIDEPSLDEEAGAEPDDERATTDVQRDQQ
jgi:hypothetical protein